MGIDVHDSLQLVVDETTFLDFLGVLWRDRAEEVAIERVTPSPPYSAGARGWENGTIEAFLESAERGARDSLWIADRTTNPWRRAAEILYMGKIYE